MLLTYLAYLQLLLSDIRIRCSSHRQLYRRSRIQQTVVNALFRYFDMFIPLESSLRRTSNDELIFIVL